MKVCSDPECDRPTIARGLCTMHYARHRKASGPACSIDGCEKSVNSRGWCSAHYSKWVKYGDPLHIALIRGEHNHQWTGDKANSKTVHLRLRRTRGPAKLQSCERCGAAAKDWSYIGGCPGERIDIDPEGYPVKYCHHIHEHYVPRCTRCHALIDKREGKTHCPQGHEYTEENTSWSKPRGNRRPARSCRTCQRAHQERLKGLPRDKRQLKYLDERTSEWSMD